MRAIMRRRSFWACAALFALSAGWNFGLRAEAVETTGPTEPSCAPVGGGLWKTTDGGAKWAPVTDGQIKSSSVGAVAVSESNPDVVFIGMGETCIPGNIMSGDGRDKEADA